MQYLGHGRRRIRAITSALARPCLRLYVRTDVTFFYISYYLVIIIVSDTSSCFTLTVPSARYYVPFGLHTSCMRSPFPAVHTRWALGFSK